MARSTIPSPEGKSEHSVKSKRNKACQNATNIRFKKTNSTNRAPSEIGNAKRNVVLVLWHDDRGPVAFSDVVWGYDCECCLFNRTHNLSRLTPKPRARLASEENSKKAESKPKAKADPPPTKATKMK